MPPLRTGVFGLMVPDSQNPTPVRLPDRTHEAAERILRSARGPGLNEFTLDEVLAFRVSHAEKWHSLSEDQRVAAEVASIFMLLAGRASLLGLHSRNAVVGELRQLAAELEDL